MDELALDIVNNDVDWLKIHGWLPPEDLAEDKPDDDGEYYYCGICGRVPISLFPNCH